VTEAWAPGQGSLVALIATFATRLANASRAAGPPLFFGLRLWISVCLALYLAFWLELDDPDWAGVTAALVCQPHLGASLRKGWYRMIGTVVGGVAIVVLTACFPQDRVAFLVGLALWGAGCAFVATILRNSPLALAAQLAGITAAIIAASELGATGGASGEVFMLAVIRCTEISIGIVSAGVVLLGTDFGNCSPPFPPKLRADLRAHWRWPDPSSRIHSRHAVNLSGESSHSTRSLTKRLASPPSSGTIRQCCRRR